jgi:diguanylate cyclase (GGDEF)-like protein
MVELRDDGRSPLYAAIRWLSARSARGLLLTAVALIAVIGWADHVTGADVSCSVGYLIPVFLAATGGRRASLTVATMSAVTWSAIEFSSRTGPYSAAYVPYWNFFARFAVLGMVAVLVSLLTTRLAVERDLSRTDPLTGLPNARAFQEATAAEIERMRRCGGMLTAAYVDVDDFKAVNDTHGHATGDDLLVLAARAMTAALRDGDVVARLGGDEFALLLPGADLAEATARLREMHAALVAATAGGTPPVGFSIGAVTWTEAPHSGQQLVARADRVMYAVKQHGKNTVWTEAAEESATAER